MTIKSIKNVLHIFLKCADFLVQLFTLHLHNKYKCVLKQTKVHCICRNTVGLSGFVSFLVSHI